MVARHLELIDAEIARAPSQVSADRLRGKRALYLVRQGHLLEARAVSSELRSRYDSRPDASISSWLNLVDGLALFFEGREFDAMDKVQRALVLATVADLSSMRSLCAGWLANLKFGLLDVDAMSRCLEESLRFASDVDHQALSRACLVGAVSLHFGNRYDLAKRWYRSARAHAAEDADEATVSALIHNMACMGVANLRQAVLTGVRRSPWGEPDALLEAESTISYDSLVGTTSASTWAPILKAQASSLHGRPAQALDIYQANIDAAKQQGLGRVLCYMYADIAWCQSQTGKIEEAIASATVASENFLPSTLVDDRAATHSRLAATFKVLGYAKEAQLHSGLAESGWGEFARLQNKIIERLQHLTPK